MPGSSVSSATRTFSATDHRQRHCDDHLLNS